MRYNKKDYYKYGSIIEIKFTKEERKDLLIAYLYAISKRQDYAYQDKAILHLLIGSVVHQPKKVVRRYLASEIMAQGIAYTDNEDSYYNNTLKGKYENIVEFAIKSEYSHCYDLEEILVAYYLLLFYMDTTSGIVSEHMKEFVTNLSVVWDNLLIIRLNQLREWSNKD